MRVNEWDIYQAIGELPLDLIKTSSPKWPKRLGVGLSSAVALFLVAAIGFHTIFGYSGPIDKGDGPPMYLGPVTALGIAPTDAGAAELTSLLSKKNLRWRRTQTTACKWNTMSKQTRS